jgi:hypothetical protein
MLRDQLLFRNDLDDDTTVQLSNANSTLGNLLLDADWDGCLEYLATPEGRHDAQATNDPLGLGGGGRGFGGGGGDDEDVDSAFFAALLVRAPIAVVEAMLDAAPPSHVGLSRHLAHVLCVVPSEEGARAVPRWRTRTWSTSEHEGILRLLLRSLVAPSSSPGSSSLLLERRTCPPRRRRGGGAWSSSSDGGASLLTPLAIAAYNPDIPPSIARLLCALEPRVMEAECDFLPGGVVGGGAAAVKTLPLFLAAASPLPPASSPEHAGMRERRWEKVALLTLSGEWHEGQGEVLLRAGDDAVLASPPPEPTSPEVGRACEEAIRRDEWELVREYARRYPPSFFLGGGGDVAWEALARHDERETADAERREREEGKGRSMGEWLRRNMGPVMYEIDAAMDLASAVIPESWKKCRSGTGGRRGIVMRMS